MNAATLLSLIAAAIEVVMGALALAFAAAPGWRHFRTFAIIAFTAAAYSAGNVAFASEGSSQWLLPWVARLNTALSCAHCAAWIVYVRVQYGDVVRRGDWAAVGCLALLGAVSLVPGAAMTDRISQQHVAWANVTYHIPGHSLLGAFLIALIPTALLAPALRYVAKARVGAPGARMHAFGFSIFFAAALNEVLVALNLIDNLYLADVGFLAAVLSVSAEMAYRVTGDARRLQALSAGLSRQVEERTRELSETRDNLARAERLAALGRLSASIGHEINNPLSYVIGNLEFAAKELAGAQAPALVAALEDARSGADRIQKIVRELRVFSRGAEGDQRQLVDVREVLEAAIKLVSVELRYRARLERDLASVPRVLADPNKLNQVFVNLLMNAAQAIPEDGAALGEPVITVRTRRLGEEQIAIEILDTGVGISEADRRRLFEPFFSTKAQDKGNGLGLFVSLGIVTAFGGRIDVESQVGSGTTVRIVLPVAGDVQAEARRPQSSPPTSSRSRRLLVVDDDVLVARTLARQLSGHSVEVVASGRDALARLSKSGPSFDIVLCDLMMPGMTGMDVYEEVARTQPCLANRFVFISGGGVTERSRKFIELHADRVLPKPIDSRLLSKLLAQPSDAGSPRP